MSTLHPKFEKKIGNISAELRLNVQEAEYNLEAAWKKKTSTTRIVELQEALDLAKTRFNEYQEWYANK